MTWRVGGWLTFVIAAAAVAAFLARPDVIRGAPNTATLLLPAAAGEGLWRLDVRLVGAVVLVTPQARLPLERSAPSCRADQDEIACHVLYSRASTGPETLRIEASP